MFTEIKPWGMSPSSADKKPHDMRLETLSQVNERWLYLNKHAMQF